MEDRDLLPVRYGTRLRRRGAEAARAGGRAPRTLAGRARARERGAVRASRCASRAPTDGPAPSRDAARRATSGSPRRARDAATVAGRTDESA